MAPKTSQVPGLFNVQDRVKQLIPTEVEIEGHVFKIKRPGKVLRAIIAMAPEDEFELNKDGTPKTDEHGEKVLKDDPDENIRLLYDSLALLFVDPETSKTPKIEDLLREGVSPDDEGEPSTFAEWLDSEMDFDVAQELFSQLVPRRGEGNPTESASAKDS